MRKPKFSTKKLGKQIDKWTSGYYSSGYKSSTKGYSQSSFWLDDDFLSKDYSMSDSEAKANDLIKLAGYKRAIANFVRIVTNKDNIPVSFATNGASYTDGKTVVISSKLDEKEFDPTVGLALHEGSHIALTNFNSLDLCYSDSFISSIRTYAKNKNKYLGESDVSDITKDLINIIEDRRIDNYVYTAAPGYRGYYLSLYEKYFNDPSIDEALIENLKTDSTMDNYLFHICNFPNPNRNLSALPGLKEIWDLIDLPNISRLKSTDEVVMVAVDVFKKIIDNVDLPPFNSKSESPTGTEGTPGPNGNGQSGSGEDEDENSGNGLSMETGSNGDNSDNGNGNASDADKLNAKSERFRKALEKAIEKQKEFLQGKVKKKSLSRKDQQVVEAMSDSSVSTHEVGSGVKSGWYTKGAKTQCIVVRGFKRQVIDSGVLGSHHRERDRDFERERAEFMQRSPGVDLPYYCQDHVQEGFTLGKLLGRKLQTRNEERSLKTTRLDAGRIDKRLIAELGFGNDRVFSQILHNTVTPAIIYLSIDASGSMHGQKWNSAMKTSVAIAKAASMTNNLQCVISIRGCCSAYTSGLNNPLMWVIYDSRKDNIDTMYSKFHQVTASGSTPEGLCYEAVMKEVIASADGKEAYFINICDGEPGYSNRDFHYGGTEAIEHTRRQVDKMSKAGIQILSFFVYGGNGYNPTSESNHRSMYGKGATMCDLNNLNQLSKSINSMFIRSND